MFEDEKEYIILPIISISLNDLSNLQNHLSLPYSPAPEGFQAKSRTRPKTTKPWQEYYDTKTIELVAKCCAEEINRFNYNFDGT